ncbi:MAG: hypothetical protein J0L62_03055 [Bacteroidetes bacterium]|nr:hypothetical protein [Bacteroidota bacterium]
MKKVFIGFVVVTVLIFAFWGKIKPVLYNGIGIIDDTHQEVEKKVEDGIKKVDSIK